MNAHPPSRPAQTAALFLSVAILVLGNGLQGTLIGVRAGIDGMGQEQIGLVMSSYFIGFAAGSIYAPRLIAEIGHIRCFAALASVTSAVALAYLIFTTPLAWSALRAVHGACYAGLLIVVESWLNAVTPRARRGRTLALYNIVISAAWIASQPLLNVAAPSGFLLFCIVSIFLSLALVPITVSRVGGPAVVATERCKLNRLYAISPIGVVGAFMVGLWSSAFWGMGPTFSQQIGLSVAGISAFMAIPMAGALLLQWPLGWLSDRTDRRLIIVAACFIGGLLAFAIAAIAGRSIAVLLALCFAYGGFSITIYAICVAHVNDTIEHDELVPVASTLILIYGVGSVFGPLIAGFLMARIGPGALFLFIGCAQLAYAAFGAYRVTRRAAIEDGAKDAFVAVPRTTPAAVTLHDYATTPPAGEDAQK